jgi:hypothetical protein
VTNPLALIPGVLGLVAALGYLIDSIQHRLTWVRIVVVSCWFLFGIAMIWKAFQPKGQNQN